MEIKLNLEYNQILKLVQQLPSDQIEKLMKTLEDQLRTRKETISKIRLKQLLLNAPTWTDEQFEMYKNARNSFNNSRLG